MGMHSIQLDDVPLQRVMAGRQVCYCVAASLYGPAGHDMLNLAHHFFRRLRSGCVLLCWLLVGGLVFAGSYSPDHIPNPRDGGSGHIANPDGLIDEGSAAQLQQLLSRLEADTGAQVAVVAVEDIHEPSDIFTFAQALFERWGIGQKG